MAMEKRYPLARLGVVALYSEPQSDRQVGR